MEGVLGFGKPEHRPFQCPHVSLVPQGTLQIRIRFVRQRFDPTLESNKQTTSIIILKWKLKYYLIALVFANSSLILMYTSLIVGHVLLQISTCRNAMTLATSLIYGFMHLSKGRSKEETEFLQASTGLNPRIFRIARQTFVIISDFFF